MRQVTKGAHQGASASTQGHQKAGGRTLASSRAAAQGPPSAHRPRQAATAARHTPIQNHAMPMPPSNMHRSPAPAGSVRYTSIEDTRRIQTMPTPSSTRIADSTSQPRSEEHTSELQSRENLVCRLL